MTATTYRRMDVVMIKQEFTDEWILGIIDKDFDPDQTWIKATGKESDCCESMRCPGYEPDEVRPATDADIVNAPEFAREWLQKRREQEELRLLNLRDPMVGTKSLKGVASLRAAGISRISDLARFTDKELLSLVGVGKTAVAQWRTQALQLKEART